MSDDFFWYRPFSVMPPATFEVGSVPDDVFEGLCVHPRAQEQLMQLFAEMVLRQFEERSFMGNLVKPAGTQPFRFATGGVARTDPEPPILLNISREYVIPRADIVPQSSHKYADILKQFTNSAP